jgi:threonine/homoserine/homoserine lactone efflux protein
MIAGIHDLGLFVVSGLLLNITPGADTLYIVGRSTVQGRKAGAVAALGIGAGCLVHTFAAAVGLSAILATSAAAFAVVKWVGAAYLVWLGIGLLRAGRDPASSPVATRLRETRLANVFLQGLLTNVLNPKVALFFLAFLPQFIEAAAPNKALAFVALGLIFNVNGTLWNLLVATMAAGAGKRFGGGPAAVWLRRIAGGLFVYLGVRLALAERG